MASLTSRDTVDQTKATIGELGSRYMLHPETMAIGTEAKYPNGFAWYMTGRGGVLGDVDADVVYAAFGFFGPGLIRRMWEAGIAVESPRAAGRRYAGACAEFGRRRLQGVEGLNRFNELAGRVLESVDASGLPLFAALRRETAPADAPALAYWNIALLREWRGSEHVVAVRAAGLTPGQAVLSDHDDIEKGREQAKTRGFGENVSEPSDLLDRRRKAEEMTSELQAPGYDVLTPAERSEFVSLVAVLKEALDANK
jgi:hypothetical protein